jgi:xylan 1,4-beta-xylosidase
VVRANIESIGLADSLVYWAFTDVFEENAAGDTIFHGGFGLINFQGVVKPTFHAYRFLHLLGDEEIHRAPGVIATRDTLSKTIHVLAYHYPSELREAPPLSSSPAEAEKILAIGQPRNLHIEIHDLPPNSQFLVETLDASHGFCLTAWKKIGSPEPPSREQAKLLREAGWNLRREFLNADASGTFRLDRSLEPWTVIMLQEIPLS